MRTTVFGLVLVGCALSTPALAQDAGRNFGARLSGEEEVPPVDTDARGLAHLRFFRGGLRWTLQLGGIDNLSAAHIHCAPAGVDGEVGVTLIELSGPHALARIDGRVLDPDEGNACGWETIGEVYDAIAAGDAYVNVHTEDQPGGEIRGQLAAPEPDPQPQP